VTAAGDVDHDTLVTMVLDSLVGWTLDDGEPEARRFHGEAAIAGRTDVLVTQRPLEQVVLIMGVPGIVASDPRRTDLNVLASILGGGSSARLFQEIREKRGLAYSVDAFPVMYSDAGVLGMAAGCAPHHVTEVVGLMRDGFESMTSVTDAEGRVTLADTLTYAARLKPSAIIDLATLTGACVVALGEEYTGLMSNNDELAEKVAKAAKAAGENVWRLPLPEEYKELIKTDIADYKNDAPRWGGSCSRRKRRRSGRRRGRRWVGWVGWVGGMISTVLAWQWARQ
jgi:hypothetical protein